MLSMLQLMLLFIGGACLCAHVGSVETITASPKPTTLPPNVNTTGASTLVSHQSTDASIESTCSAINGTCSDVTTTPTTPMEEDRWKHVQVQSTYYKFKGNNRSVCQCDLHNRYCDINCCCDKECSLEAKQAFSFCEDARTLPQPNTNYCNYMQYIYNNRTLREIEVKQNSLWCIAKTNLPAHYFKQKKKILTHPLHANDMIKRSSSHQWVVPKSEIAIADGYFVNRTAQFADSVYAIKNYSLPKKLEIPTNFISSDCIATKQVEYLKDVTSACKQILHFQNAQLMVQNYFNLTVLSSLRFLNVSLNNYEGCPKNICIPVKLTQCDKFSCWNMSTRLQSECTPKSCVNVVTGIKYRFYHNATHGIQKVDVDITLQNLTLPPIYVDQEYEVKFLWTNQSEYNYSDVRSGNPGYQVGKPILWGKLITIINATTNSTTNKTTIVRTQRMDRNPLNYIANFLALPQNVNGRCVLSTRTYESIEFAYNMRTKCAHVQGFAQKNDTSVNGTCWLLQNNILAYWSMDVDAQQWANTTRNHTFGHFGNARSDRLEEWGHFLFDIYPGELLNETYGRAIGNNNIECQNISTGIKYSIFYERVEDEQHRIAAIYVEFVRSGDAVRLDVHNGNHVFGGVLLTGDVMFYDVTGVRDKKYVDPPSLDIRLPYDFFYPFVKVDNAGRNVQPSEFLITLLLICFTITL